MITQDEIFSEVRSTFESYEESGLIDDTSLRGWLIPEIKRFGNNIMSRESSIVEVDNGVGYLPENFWMLDEAWRYYPDHYCTDAKRLDLHKHRYIHKHNLKKDCECDNKNFLSKKEWIGGVSAFYTYYNRPTMLRLRPGYNKNVVSAKCINVPSRVALRSKNQIDVRENVLYTEFKEGSVYILYKGLPTDEDGNIALPSTQHDSLYKYIISFLEYKALRKIFMNGDDPNVWNKIRLLKEESDENFSLAYRESKAGVFSPESWKKLRNDNRIRKRKVEIITPNLNF